MRIRKFTSNTILDNVQNLCDLHLAYLRDNDFLLSVNYLQRSDCVSIRIERKNYFSWNLVKDNIIPLLIQLKKLYSLWDIDFFILDADRSLTGFYEISVNSVIAESSDKLEYSRGLGSICFTVWK
jgi:hypothetical protein